LFVSLEIYVKYHHRLSVSPQVTLLCVFWFNKTKIYIVYERGNVWNDGNIGLVESQHQVRSM